MAYEYEFELGLAYGTMVNVEDTAYLANPPHPWEFKHGTERFVGGDGKSYYDGYPQLTWNFTYIPPSAWTWLIGTFFASDATCADVYVKTKKADETYQVYTAIMHRPEVGEDVERGIHGYYDMELRFTHLEEYTP